MPLATWNAGMGDHVAITPIYTGPLVSIGTFWCHPDDVRWRLDNYIGEVAHITFPATSVRISPVGGGPVLSGPNHAVFLDAGAVFRRERFRGQGDRNHFMVLDAAALEELLREALGPKRTPHFPRVIGRLPARIFLAERTLSRALARGIEELEAEELLLRLAFETVRGAFAPAREQTRPVPRRAATLVEAAKALLTARAAERLTLREIGRALNVSPFYLARVFRARTGYALHEYLLELRVRRAVDRIYDGSSDLAELAAELGFSSHSHLTTTFRRIFGVPPSALRLRSVAANEARLRFQDRAQFLAPGRPLSERCHTVRRRRASDGL